MNKNNMSFQNINIKKVTLWFFIVIFIAAVSYFLIPKVFGTIKYESAQPLVIENNELKDNAQIVPAQPEIKTETIVPVAELPVSHIKTPSAVKALYISSWVAGSPKFRDSVIKIIDETEINAIVIDIKDSTGRISFKINEPDIIELGAAENRISNIRALTALLHKKNIYIIGRISVFQDPYLAKKKPEWAITRLSDGEIWKDRKGLSFLDPAKKEVHDYIVDIALNSYDQGFDELNFDYIRYPSDGNMKDINYHLKQGETRSGNLEKFFVYLNSEVKKVNNIPISADLFGLTTEARDDMGIGQLWEKAVPHFDFVSPMVYPSHYPAGTLGYKNPAAYPYEIIDHALESAVVRTKAINQDILKIRPWLQDFDMGATYTKEMVRAQIKATYDNGLNSWMLWDPSNKYTPSALLLETN